MYRRAVTPLRGHQRNWVAPTRGPQAGTEQAGQTFTMTTPHSSTHATAEWIEETPVVVGTSGTGVGPLPNLSTVNIDLAKANNAPAGLKASEEMQLINSSGNPLSTLQLACQGSIGGKTIRGNADFKGIATGGAATCYLKLPKSARGKRLEGVFDLTFEGVTTHNTFVVRVH